jgi:hypothetical protein
MATHHLSATLTAYCRMERSPGIRPWNEITIDTRARRPLQATAPIPAGSAGNYLSFGTVTPMNWLWSPRRTSSKTVLPAFTSFVAASNSATLPIFC